MDTQSNLIIKRIEAGHMRNFIYLIGDRATGEVAVIDPAWDLPLIRQQAEEDNLKIVAVLLTHGHYDHSDGADEMAAPNNLSVYLSEHEAEIYIPSCRNLLKTKDHQKIQIGQITIECLWTPGHTPGCQCFYVPGHLLTGDTLFVNGCGRCDLPGGDPIRMYESLYQIIAKLPDDTVIYPGHAYGPSDTATLENQKKYNLYLTCHDKQDFLSRRMGIDDFFIK